ncbi:MAG: hypothetical protein IPK35_04425 [Saprospiraceae bacterium]|nr:hypothetical protein [Saprospiraceae bacterium]
MLKVSEETFMSSKFELANDPFRDKFDKRALAISAFDSNCALEVIPVKIKPRKNKKVAMGKWLLIMLKLIILIKVQK